ncbi:MAG: hypothetical protein IANPNBLG_03378 [Bryobacteraceae bacterium]|nr:hypothetical protein [Bryobacteraceae bacterium]
MAKGSREAESTTMFRFPAIDNAAPSEMIPAPQVPRNRLAASASGRLEAANSGSVPMHTT